MIELKNIAKTYRVRGKEVKALDGVHLKIEKGSFTAVVGPSGCGKSTLLMLVGCLTRPSSGVMLKDGADVFGNLNASERALLRAAEIGFVFQNFQLIPYLTAFENILTPKLAVAESKTSAHDLAESFLQRFGLNERRNHLPDEMSIGERQRTALARSLMNKPNILLADEPTGNLDPQNTEIVMRHLQDFHQAGGTVLLVTHDRSLCAYAQRTIRMETGRILDS